MGLVGWGGRGREVSMFRFREGLGDGGATHEMGAQKKG